MNFYLHDELNGIKYYFETNFSNNISLSTFLKCDIFTNLLDLLGAKYQCCFNFIPTRSPSFGYDVSVDNAEYHILISEILQLFKDNDHADAKTTVKLQHFYEKQMDVFYQTFDTNGRSCYLKY